MKRSRGWILTINYKDSIPEDNAALEERVKNINGITYFAFQLEKGENETKHHQLYISFKDAKSFEKIKKIFPTAHIESIRGTPEEASNYCTKDESRIGEPIIWGELPIKGRRNDLEDIYDMIKNGATSYEIRDTYPSQYIRYQDKIVKVIQEMLEEKYRKIFRKLEVYYLSDETGVGKSRFIMEHYGYANVFRVSNYKNPFDQYKNEDVLVLEEFRSSLPIELMLHILDGYPIQLPARYNDRVACYTKVFVVSNWEYSDQYKSIQNEHPKTFKAFTRRFTLRGNLSLIKMYINNKEMFEVNRDED